MFMQIYNDKLLYNENNIKVYDAANLPLGCRRVKFRNRTDALRRLIIYLESIAVCFSLTQLYMMTKKQTETRANTRRHI